MKRIITCLAVVLCSTSAFSQYYFNTYNPAGMNPGGLNTDAEQPFGAAGVTAGDGYSELIQASGQGPAPGLQWSAPQTIPFAFDFNGSAETQFKVSNSGVLTFTTSATSVPSTINTTLPSANIPDKSVVIWGLAQGAGNDGVLLKVHGTAPNRQLWVNFASFSSTGGAIDPASGHWTYWGIVLEETTNNIYIADLRSFNTSLDLTLGIQIDGSTAVEIAGAPNTQSFVTNGGNASDPSDNVYYEFIQGTRTANDILISSVDLDKIQSIASPITITGEAKNNGSAAITSFDLSWTADGGVTNSTVNIPANIAPGDAYTYTHPTTWSPAAGSSYTVEVTASNPNGVVDGNPSNNSASATTFINLGQTVSRSVLLEEFTTIPCGFCPNATITSEYIVNNVQNSILVGLHACFGTDIMTNSESVELCQDLGNGSAPSGMVDRVLFDGEARPTFGINFNSSVPSSANPWFIRARDRTAEGSSVNVDIKGNYNSSTRTIDVDVKSNFVDYPLPGDISVSLMIVEDSVTGGSSYSQRNFYNATPGHPFAGLGDPIVGYVHEHVLRQILPLTYGDATVIPSSPVLYTDYARNFNLVLNNSYDESQVYLVAVVSYRGPGLEEYEVLNAKEVKLTELFGVGISEKEVKGNTSFDVYPNPSKDITNISFDLDNKESIFVSVRDITGKEVMSQDFGVMAQGNQRIAINVSSLSNGIYFTTLQIGDKMVTKKITVNK
ncbi:MAG: hypothetical protein ACJAV5_000066 [Vicingaceae bacterium]|jgi:hypothetical protein